MALISSAQITCLTTPTLLAAADTDGCRVVLHKEQAHTIYVGGSDVTTNNGFLFDHDGTIEINLPPNAKIYGTSVSGTQVAYVLIIGN